MEKAWEVQREVVQAVGMDVNPKQVRGGWRSAALRRDHTTDLDQPYSILQTSLA